MIDTIAAISTPFGEGAIAVIRISGPQALPILGSVFGGPTPQPRMLSRGRIEENGAVIDDVLAVVFKAPKSFTGEDMAEIHCHGGLWVTRKILDALIRAGARVAEPGEFSLRAFTNGKMDLTQAEAVMDVIRAQTDLALRAAQEQLAGRLGQQVAALRQALLEILAHVEAYIDFPDEDIEPETGEIILNRIRTTKRDMETLVATADQGRLLREGVRTVIHGAPNVGKSSLLNILTGFDRAIVSATPGTTRDTIEEHVNIGGIPLRLIDTAGIRDDTDDHLEKLGIERSRNALAQADLILHVFDASEPPPSAFPDDPRTLIILNKSDLQIDSGWQGTAAVPISCTANTGFEVLRARISAKIFGDDLTLENVSVAINARHKACLSHAIAGCSAAITGLQCQIPVEFIAVELHSALDAVGEVIGRVDTEEILGKIFSTFCIGK
ncbi:MAG TPA: tRNA uridine-5-carboxymethylaminomethyl(34) synthesis GTPase MnmE [Chthoniobacterales bacterium]